MGVHCTGGTVPGYPSEYKLANTSSRSSERVEMTWDLGAKNRRYLDFRL